MGFGYAASLPAGRLLTLSRSVINIANQRHTEQVSVPLVGVDYPQGILTRLPPRHALPEHWPTATPFF